MCGRRTKLLSILLFLAALAPNATWAKKINFGNASPFVLGFGAGIEKKPRTDFVDKPQSITPKYGYNLSLNPSFDFINFAIRTHLAYHNHPLAKNSGALGAGTYQDSSDGSSFSYGAGLLLAPFVASSLSSRQYFTGGIMMSNTSLSNVRNTYSASGVLLNTYQEKAKGGATRVYAGIGTEFFLMQNYSFLFEAGYQQYNVKEFTHGTERDIYGNAVEKGQTIFSPYGSYKTFRTTGAYFNFGLNLHF